MKKLFFMIASAALFPAAYAQVCTPVWTDTTFGINPDTITNLPPAYLNTPYDITVQFKVPTEAPYLGDTVHVYKVALTGVDSLAQIPASDPFHYNCNPPDCVFISDSVGCVKIQGTPTEIGTYDLVIQTNVYIFPNAGIPFPTPGYRIKVNYPIGIAPLDQKKFDVSQNSPNPFSNKTEIYVNLVHAGNFTVRVSNLVGNEILRQSISGKKGINTASIDGTKWAPGIYFCTISDGEHSMTRRMVIDRR